MSDGETEVAIAKVADAVTGVTTELTKLRKRRGGNAGYVRKVIGEVQILVNGTSKDRKIQLDARKDILSDKENVLKDYHEKIMDHLETDEDIEKEVHAHSDLATDIRKCLHSINNSCEPKLIDSFSPKASSTSARLPKLQLKSFDGDPLEFLPFWDSFSSAVDSNNSLDDISKFNYLKGLLEGKAKACLLGIDTTAANYKVAVNLLQERFGDPQSIINSHMDTLLSIQPLKSDSVGDLRKLYDLIEVHTRSLEFFGIATNNYGPILNSIVMAKIPRNIKLDISRQMPQGKWDIVRLMDIFKKELVARERCDQFENLTENMNSDFSTPSSTLFTGSTKPLFCTYCKSHDHTSNQCNIITDIAARKKFLQEGRRCFVCLRVGHTGKVCFSQYTCFRCKGKHHISICDQKGIPTGERNDDNQSNQSNGGTSLMISMHNKVLLQTASGMVSNANGNNWTGVKMLFDNGSQRSFIKKDLVRRLNLKSIRSEALTIKTFGSVADSIQKLDVVNVSVKGKFGGNDKRVIEAYVVPVICAPVAHQSIQMAVNMYPELKDMRLADNNVIKSNKEVELLVGANFYWNCITGRTRRISKSLVACESVFGWILSGSLQGNDADINVSSVNLSSTHALKVACEKIPSNDSLCDIKLNSEPYIVPLPCKPETEMLPDKFSTCVARLSNSSSLRLRKDPGLLEDNDNIIKQQFDRFLNKNEEGKSVKYFVKQPVDTWITRRTVLICVSGYDPLRWLALVTALFKLFFHVICMDKLKLDEPLITPDLSSKWQGLDAIASVSIKVHRHYLWNNFTNNSTVNLHGFCDISIWAYAVIGFIVVEIDGECKGQLVARETKVTPNQKIILPRSELCAYILLANLIFSVLSAFNGVLSISQVSWRESLCFIHCIKGKDRLHDVSIAINARTLILLPKDGHLQLLLTKAHEFANHSRPVEKFQPIEVRCTEIDQHELERDDVTKAEKTERSGRKWNISTDMAMIFIKTSVILMDDFELRSTENVTDDVIRESETEQHEPESGDVTITEKTEIQCCASVTRIFVKRSALSINKSINDDQVHAHA